MSLLSELKPNKGSNYKAKRIGRGIGSGKGGTASKGHKGQKARKGGAVRRGFEGGQTPMARRLPKFGFTNGAFKTRYEVINLRDIEKWAEKMSVSELSPDALKKYGIISGNLLKILGDGEIKKGLTIKAHKFSKSAKDSIEKAGGKAEVI
ncbi:MAG: 50S ribosomal protein L15 [Bdellovibrionales bacterium]|nr:50S ribosomal protein L15 [Bdellovibrionales bacterium]